MQQVARRVFIERREGEALLSSAQDLLDAVLESRSSSSGWSLNQIAPFSFSTLSVRSQENEARSFLVERPKCP